MKKRARTFLSRLGWIEISTISLLVVNIVMGSYLAVANSASEGGGYPEVAELAEKSLGFKDLSNYFTELAEEKGGVYAFEVLKRAPVPPNVDIHLLGHVIGDILYTQKGAEAITLCTDDFRNACSHTIVIGTLLEKGPESFSEIAELCRRAPGGSGAYTMCFHGLGHGVLAFNEYELPQAIKMCEKSSATKGREYIECVGGAIMEMMAGVHDRDMWLEKTKKYFKKDDPLYPCSAPFMPDDAKSICYTYLTPHLFEAAGANLGRPQPADFKEAFTYCDPIQSIGRRACFGGFGKEFVVLAQNRDVRAIERMADEQLSTVLDWCELASPEDGSTACMIEALQSLYWGGENDPGAALRYCALADKRGEWGEACALSLIDAVGYYVKDAAYREDICSRLQSAYQDRCRERLSR